MEIEKMRAFIIKFVYYSIMAAVAVVVIKWGLPMVSPFVLGFLIAYVLRWPTRYLTSRFGLAYKPVALGLVLLFYSTVGLLLAFLAVRAFSLIQSLVNLLPALYVTHIVPVIEDIFSIAGKIVYEMDETLFNLIRGYGSKFLDSLTSFVTSLSGKAVTAASNLVVSVPGLFVRLVLVIISSFFIAADYDTLRGFCVRQMGEKSAALFVSGNIWWAPCLCASLPMQSSPA